jgi:hypothetical protein
MAKTARKSKEMPRFDPKGYMGGIGRFMLLVDLGGALWKIDGETGEISRVE